MAEVIPALWIIFIFAFAIAEMTKLHGDLFSFAVGGVGGLVTALITNNILLEVIVAVICTALSFLILRPLFIKATDNLQKKQTIDPSYYVGMSARVTEKVDGEKGTGRVVANGADFLASPKQAKQKYNVGDQVKIVGYEGKMVIVNK